MSDLKLNFSELVGNQLNISLLKRSLANNTFRQFTIFSGVLGTGKSTCARISALALTCENPNNGEPCCNCPTCKANIAAFNHHMDSPYISTVNAGKLIKREDVNELIHNIFDLQGSTRNKVFLIEEAHALTKITGAETVFLSELDTMPNNIYLIFSTTRLFDLKDELTSRAEKYTFGRLSDLESKQLLVSTAEYIGYAVPDDIINLIVKQGKGIPRNLINALEYTIDEDVTLSELRAHLQVIDDSQLVQLFESMTTLEIQTYVETLASIKEAVETQSILNSVKSFLVQVAFVIEGDIHGTFTKDEVNTIKHIFPRDKFYKIVKLFNAQQKKITDADLDMVLLQTRLILQQRSINSVITESAKVGAVEREATNEVQAVRQKTASAVSTRPITLAAIKRFGDNE